MKYLFVVQGEGRGHLTQAIALSQMLRSNGHEVVEVLVGKCSNRELPSFFAQKIAAPTRIFESPAMDYGKSGKKGKIAKTIFVNTTPRKLAKWRKSIELIVDRIEKSAPDVIVNFYEMLVGIANLIYRFKTPVVTLAHQFLIEHPDYQHRSRTDHGQFVLRLNNMLCSFGTTKTLALSFYPLRDVYRDRMAVLPPLLRQEIFELQPSDSDYLLGYMLNPAYMEEVKRWHKNQKGGRLHLFWDKKDAPERCEIEEGVTAHRINDSTFLSYMERCKGYITTAGFESVCEAMYLGKPILMIPAHIEQEINASDAASVGAGIVAKDFNIAKLVDYIPHYNADTSAFRRWVESAETEFLRHLTTLV